MLLGKLERIAEVRSRLDEGKFMPAGLMLILSAISVLLVILVLVQPKERKRDF